ncbi:MAG: calcium-binding protein [Myxococcota bacterium]
MKVRLSLLSLSLAVVTLSTAGCQGALTDDEQAVGEATSYLTASEETGDLASEAVAAEEVTVMEAEAEDAAVLPELPSSDADGVCNFGAVKARVIARYDANGDGVLGPVERQALKADLEDRTHHPLATRFVIKHRLHVLKRLKWVFDENSDGVLSPEERTALVDAMQARCERVKANVMQRFDANGDGVLDATERQAAKAALVARIQAARQEVLSRYDANGNGVLDPGERQAFKADLIAAWQAKKAEVKAQFDADSDGTLNDAEKLALKQHLQQRIIEGRDAE